MMGIPILARLHLYNECLLWEFLHWQDCTLILKCSPQLSYHHEHISQGNKEVSIANTRTSALKKNPIPAAARDVRFNIKRYRKNLTASVSKPGTDYSRIYTENMVPTLFQKRNSRTFKGLFKHKITFFKHYGIAI